MDSKLLICSFVHLVPNLHLQAYYAYYVPDTWQVFHSFSQ